MAAGKDIAEFYARLKIQIDNAEIRRMDSTLRNIERRLQSFSRNLKNSNGLKIKLDILSVDQTSLRAKIQKSLDNVAKTTALPIIHFAVDENALRNAIIRAWLRAGRGPLPPLPPPPIPPGGGPGGGRRGSGPGGFGAGMALGRVLPIGLALAGGGYGLSQLNERNQALVAAQLQSSAVVQQAGGTPEQGKQSFEWLRAQGNRIGFNYLDAAQEYNTLLANMTGAGMSVKQGQDVFSSFAELSRTFKLGRVQQQRVNLALSQIAGKGQLQSQELKLQLGQALPGAEGMFAQAYQNMIGGNKTGQESIAALLEAMKKGKVSSDILNYVAPIAHEKAMQGGFDNAVQASQAEQARLQNQINDLMRIASDSGLESGFARIFKTIREALEESGPIAEMVGENFDKLTKKFREFALIPGDIQGMLNGKDSYIGRLIGEQGTEDFRKNVEMIKDSLEAIKRAMPDDIFFSVDSSLKKIAQIIEIVATGMGYLKKVADANDLPAKIASRTQQSMNESGDSPTGFISGARAGVMYFWSWMHSKEWQEDYYNRVKNDYPLKEETMDNNMYGYPAQFGTQGNFNIKAFMDPAAAALQGSGGFDPNIFMDSIRKQQNSQTNVTVTVGDVHIESHATNPTDFATDIQEMTKRVFYGAMVDANNQVSARNGK